MYQTRKIIDSIASNLPLEHESDSMIALFVMQYRLNIQADEEALVPIPQSINGFRILASLQKAKHPRWFRATERK